jgi:flagellar hook assembly protein FlgD
LNGQLQKGDTPDASVFTAFGKIAPFYSSNVMQFDPFYSEFSDSGATLQAQLPKPDASYTIELKTLSGNHIKTIANSTSSGQISEFWDLTDDNGNTVTDETVNAVFNVTLLDQGSGTSTRQLTKGTPVTDGNFTIAYA